jgi:hypothetical protein
LTWLFILAMCLGYANGTLDEEPARKLVHELVHLPRNPARASRSSRYRARVVQEVLMLGEFLLGLVGAGLGLEADMSSYGKSSDILG